MWSPARQASGSRPEEQSLFPLAQMSHRFSVSVLGVGVQRPLQARGKKRGYLPDLWGFSLMDLALSSPVVFGGSQNFLAHLQCEGVEV